MTPAILSVRYQRMNNRWPTDAPHCRYPLEARYLGHGDIKEAANLACRARSRCKQDSCAVFAVACLKNCTMSAAMMIYGHPIKNPRLFVVGMLLAAGLLLPVLGSLP